MLFNSMEFAIFLPIVFMLYWAIPNKYRWILLLVSSYYFYMSWNVKYVFLILFTTLVSYGCALLLESTESVSRRKGYLVLTSVVSLGVLFFFKYFNFFSESFCSLLQSFAIPMHPITLKLMLPVGISFYTFQTLSYVIDVYRGNVKAERHLGKYAAFISFFPQLVAGPIERTSNLLPQISKEHHFQYEKASYGLRLMAWGFYKKIVVADTLALYVDPVYGNVQMYKGLALIMSTVLFTIQIYCDFSGYSDIAIGTAKLFDVDLMRNFNSPYFSASIKEFWSRWHISLSTWFRDYVYIPLGGNRCKKSRHYLNLIITFLLSGLWHGANWTYVIWGAVHGVAQVIENFITGGGKKQDKGHGLRWLLAVAAVFIFCNCAWVFFRASSLGDAIYVFSHALDGITSPLTYVMAGIADMQMDRYILLYLLILILILVIYDFLSLKYDVIRKISEKKFVVRWACYIVFAVLIALLAQKGVAAEFVYFQF